jgi:predicted PurR-regulated permease PerM
MPDNRPDGIVARKPTAKALAPNAASAMTFFVMIVATLYFGKDVLMPITLAMLFAFVLSPLVNLLRRAHLGRVPSVLLGVTLGLSVVLAIGGVIGNQIATLSTDLPRYAPTMEKKVTSVRNYTIGRFSRLTDTVGHQTEKPGSSLDAPSSSSPQASPSGGTPPAAAQAPSSTPLELVERYISTVLSPFATFGIVFIVAVFALLQKEDLRDRLVRLASSDDIHRTTRAIDDGAHRLSRYFLTQLIINATFGVIIGGGLLIIGLPNPVLWGILSALLRFVPYVGSLISAVLPMALAAAVEPGWSMLLWTAGLYLVVEGVTGQVVEPMVYGNSTGLSPFSVVVAAIFWSWVWGPVGLILSTPLTLCLVVIGRHAKRLEFLDIVLGDRPPLTPAETLYQRILAGDADEAQANAEIILKERSLGIYYDAVVVKVMQVAAADAGRGAIDRDQLERADRTLRTLIEGLETYKDDPPAAAAQQPASLQPPLNSPDDLPPQLDPQNIPPATSGLSPAVLEKFPSVLCVAGRGPLDETASAILVQLLGKHGITGRLVTYEEASRARIGTLDVSSATIVCISCLDISSSPAHLRYLLQRLRQRLPREAQILAGIGSAEDTLQGEAARAAIGADFLTGSLEESVTKCVEHAIKTAQTDLSAPSPKLAIVPVG